LEKLDQAKSVVMMVDAKDKNTFKDAATTLYEVLNNVNALSDSLPLLVACNKQDLTFAKRALDLEVELVSELEQIRKVRRATSDNGD
jgi:signal recognition particle receptor subunit beta